MPTTAPRRLQLAAAGLMALALALLPAYVIRFRIGGLPATVLELVLLAALVLGVAAFARELPWLTAYSPAAAVFLLGATMGVLASPDRRAALGIWKAYFVEPVAAGLVMAAIATSRERARLLLAGLGIAGLASALFNLRADEVALAHHHFSLVTPPVAIYNTANAVPLFLVPLDAFALALLLYTEDIRERVGAAVFLAVTGVADLLSYSRAGWLALLAVIFVVTLFHPLRTRILAVAAVVAALLLVGVPGVRRRVAVELDPKNPDNTINLRLSLWRSALKMLEHRPLFGGGLSGFKQSLLSYQDPAYHEHQIYPHNLVLNFWSETGLIGLLGFIWICVSLVRSAVAGLVRDTWTRALSIGLLAMFAGVLVHGMADVPYFKNDLSLEFWALLGIQLGALRGAGFSVRAAGRTPATSHELSGSS